jgi:hypothetical protein
MEQNIVTLTQEEHDLAVSVGREYHSTARLERLTCGADQFHPYVRTEDKEWCHIIGALGEIAAAKYLGMPWDRTGDWFKKVADLGTRISVRMRSKREYGKQWAGLLIRKADFEECPPDMAFVAVVPVEKEWVIGQLNFDVTGWVYRSECEACGHWEEYNWRPSCLIVDREEQRPMSELLALVKANPAAWGIKPLKPEPLFRD